MNQLTKGLPFNQKPSPTFKFHFCGSPHVSLPIQHFMSGFDTRLYPIQIRRVRSHNLGLRTANRCPHRLRFPCLQLSPVAKPVLTGTSRRHPPKPSPRLRYASASTVTFQHPYTSRFFPAYVIKSTKLRLRHCTSA